MEVRGCHGAWRGEACPMELPGEPRTSGAGAARRVEGGGPRHQKGLSGRRAENKQTKWEKGLSGRKADKNKKWEKGLSGRMAENKCGRQAVGEGC